MPRFMLTLYQPDGPAPAPERLGAIMQSVAALNADMRAAGVWVQAAGLGPAADTMVVRTIGGKAVTTDGPFVESKEHIGGFTVIEAADRDAAVIWGGRLSAATTLPVEVRAMMER